jgi:pimeloyl-ACP methyl ester carboxylesterase
MTQHTHQTAPTQFVEANGIRFAYRRFGKTGGMPLVFNQHYIGTMDYWDPMVTDGLARDRQSHLTSFAAYLHPDFTVTAPNYLGRSTRRGSVLP